MDETINGIFRLDLYAYFSCICMSDIIPEVGLCSCVVGHNIYIQIKSLPYVNVARSHSFTADKSAPNCRVKILFPLRLNAPMARASSLILIF